MPLPRNSNQPYKLHLALPVLALCKPSLEGMAPDAQTLLGKNSLQDIGRPLVCL